LAGRDYNTVDISERVLREVYLPPYKAAIDAGAATVMTSFNELDGVPATANKFLLTKILRNEWGFKGIVVSDYTSVMEMIPHGFVADTASATEMAINAGLDMDMQAGFFDATLPKLVKEGKVTEEVLNTAVRYVLRKKFELGLFKDPYRYSDVEREKATVMKPAYLEAARDIARKSIVLLKNENNLLPLVASKKIAVIGPLANAKREMIGSWSAAGDWTKSVTLLEGIRAKVGSKAQIVYAKGSNIDDDSTKYFAEAVRAASASEMVILAVGESAQMTGEAASRSSLDLPGVQQKLVEEIAKTGKPIVIVLMNGRPLTINWIDQHIPAVLETWFLGSQGGNAIADVLFGDYNPSGKLTITFPQNLGQVPIFYSEKNTGRPRDPDNKYTSKYLDVTNEPLYPFGYGLSYTSFDYGNITLNKKEMTGDNELMVICRVTNTGKKAGEEVVQLYIRDIVGSVTRPVKELKAFQKIMLSAGESRDIVFTINKDALSFYRQDMTFGPETGKFQVFVGGNSRDLKKADFELVEKKDSKYDFLTPVSGKRDL
jgi:beta-glucosidase